MRPWAPSEKQSRFANTATTTATTVAQLLSQSSLKGALLLHFQLLPSLWLLLALWNIVEPTKMRNMLRHPLSQTPHTQRNSTATISSCRRALHEGTSDDGTTNKRVCIFVLGDSEGEREERERERSMRAVAYIRIVVFPAVWCMTTMCRMMSMISLSVAPFSSSLFLICDFLQKPYLWQVSESVFAQFDEVPLPHMGSHWCACGLSNASKSGRVCP